jgi:hypothetical protein
MLPTIATGNVASALAGEYEVANSLRFNDDDSPSLTRTDSSGTSRRTFSYSVWVKKSQAKTDTDANMIVNNASDESNQFKIELEGDHPVDLNDIRIRQMVSGSQTVVLKTSRSFRDPSAWMHILVAVDTTQSTEANRIKLYINGVQETSFSSATYPSQNSDMEVNVSGSYTTHIGKRNNNDHYFDGYMCEFVFIDGQALDPTSFGEFDSDTNIWKPIDVSGLTFGTNGFYLDFENSGSLGADVSGNGNNFTVNNLTSIDQTTDTPTNNYATWNPLMKPSSASTFSEGNLKVTNGTNSVYPYSVSNQGFSQGKWYAEFKYTPSGNAGQIGIMDLEIATTNFQANNVGSSSDGCITYQYNGNIIGDGTVHSTGNTSLSSGDIVGIAVDEDNQLIYFYVNGTLQNSGGTDYSGDAFTSGFVGFYCGDASGGGTDTWEANFGNPPYSISSGNSDANGYGNFEYAVPSGYYALNTKNLAEYG